LGRQFLALLQGQIQAKSISFFLSGGIRFATLAFMTNPMFKLKLMLIFACSITFRLTAHANLNTIYDCQVNDVPVYDPISNQRITADETGRVVRIYRGTNLAQNLVIGPERWIILRAIAGGATYPRELMVFDKNNGERSQIPTMVPLGVNAPESVELEFSVRYDGRGSVNEICTPKRSDLKCVRCRVTMW